MTTFNKSIPVIKRGKSIGKTFGSNPTTQGQVESGRFVAHVQLLGRCLSDLRAGIHLSILYSHRLHFLLRRLTPEIPKYPEGTQMINIEPMGHPAFSPVAR
jgi:hypothetical protein